jgi:DHA1 family tetracycline resistance protein-like MFS transporter
MQFLFSPLLGSLSDKFGRRPVLLFSLFFNGIDYVIMACAPTLPWLFLGRFLSGIAGASFTAASSYIADISTPENRSVNFGVIGAAFGIGFIIGPALGGFLGQMGPRVPFWASALLCAINVIYGYFVLPESLDKANRRNISLKEANPFLVLKLLKKYPLVWAMTGCIIANNLGDRFLQSTWVLVMSYKFHWNLASTGLSLTAVGLLALVFQLGVAKIAIPKFGDRAIILIGIASAVFEMIGIAIVPQGWMVYPVMLITGMNFLYNQAAQGMLSKQAPDTEQGSLQGALNGVASLTGVIGPIIGSLLFSYYTRPGLAVKIPAMPFVGAALLYAVGFVIAARALRDYHLPAAVES